MDLLYEIFITTTQILTLAIGITGFLASALLLFLPGVLQQLGNQLNYRVTSGSLIPFLNKPIRSEIVSYRHPRLSGLLLVAGALFVMNFLFLNLKLPQTGDLFIEILLETGLIIGKGSAVLGFLLGLMLLTVPERIKGIEETLDTWFDTETIVERVNKFHPHIDHIFFRHPLVFGSIGLLASFVLIILSVANVTK